eukprot:5230548-Prymnesium_polylepis.1
MSALVGGRCPDRWLAHGYVVCDCVAVGSQGGARERRLSLTHDDGETPLRSRGARGRARGAESTKLCICGARALRLMSSEHVWV